jgi:serine/threonine protein kinase
MSNRQVLNERYEVQQQLGKKSGIRTLLARDLVKDELVIVKLLAFGSDFEWDDLKLFEREAQTLKSLSHPSIPRYLDYFEVNSSNYQGFALIQTYIPAKTLDEYLENGRKFTESEVKEIAKAILEILVYLHELHPPVIHRDIKPSNILLGERSGNSVGKVYLVDFGSVQTILAAETGTRTIVGTYGYMPQEQFGGRTVPASDIYSLGATLIYLITGRQPADLPQKDFRIQFEQFANVSSKLTYWLKKMIEPSLEKRFTSAKEVLTALENPENIEITNLAIALPPGSKIQVTKNAESLEIIIPALGFQPFIIFIALFIGVWCLIVLGWTIAALAETFPGNIVLVLLTLPFWGAGLAIIYGIVVAYFSPLKININSQKISLDYYFRQWKLKKYISAPRENIHQIIYTPKHWHKNSEKDVLEVPPKLVVWVGVKKVEFDLKSVNIKSELELEWLAHELSDWLDIPMSIEPDSEKRFISAQAAEKSLENPENTNISNLNNLAIAKPAGSNIKIIKNNDFLDITIPTGGFNGVMVFSILFAVACNVGGYSFLTSGFSLIFSNHFLLFLFLLPFLGIDLWLIYGIFYGIFGKLNIRIDQKTITTTHKFGRLKIPRSSSARNNINKITYNREYFTIDSDGDRVNRGPRLVIWVGVKNFEFTVDHITIQSQVELEWIAKELSEWLDIPIMTE